MVTITKIETNWSGGKEKITRIKIKRKGKKHECTIRN